MDERKFSFPAIRSGRSLYRWSKKAGSADNKPVEKIVHGDWIPGKHTIIVKTATQGGNVLYANFKADKAYEQLPFGFSLSPQRGKNIYDVLNGKQVSHLSVSPTGKYALVGITNTVDGRSSNNTYVYRIADKEIVYTFYGNNVRNLQWIPDQDKLSFLQAEGNGQSLYSYDLENNYKPV